MTPEMRGKLIAQTERVLKAYQTELGDLRQRLATNLANIQTLNEQLEAQTKNTILIETTISRCLTQIEEQQEMLIQLRGTENK